MKKQTKWFIIPCAAMSLTLASALVSFAATGWAEESGDWVYYESDGGRATDRFAKSGNNWFYLDSDGIMAKDQLIEKDDNYYYVNSDGAMVTSQWMAIENEDASGDEPDTWWYYFQSNGKAVKKSDSGNSVKFVTLPTSSGQGKYTFDDEGRMLFGWIDESGEMLTDDDAWRSGMYYCGENGDGRMTTGWKYITAPNDDDTEREGDGYWFFFNSNGKKVKDDDSKKINGRKYRFDEDGAAHFEWYNDPGTATDSNAVNRFYNTEEQCWMSTGWFKAIPSENIDPEGYDEGEEVWYYADNDGDLVTSQIKKINGQSYGFDQYGKMLEGLYKVEFEEDGKTIRTAEEIESDSDLPDEDQDGVYVYYFGDSPKAGAMKTGTTTLEVDGENYYYSFEKSGSKKGSGTDGIDGDSIYIKGRRMEAEEGSKYQPFTYKDETYLISTAGKIMKNKKNIKDADDMYYKTDSKGIIVDSGSEKLD